MLSRKEIVAGKGIWSPPAYEWNSVPWLSGTIGDAVRHSRWREALLFPQPMLLPLVFERDVFERMIEKEA
jgi:hypothetical protein